MPNAGPNPLTTPLKPGSPPARILIAARELFFSQGFSNVSTDALSREAAVSKATLYKYFPSMGDVLAAVTTVEGDRFEPAKAPEIDSLDALRDALIDYGTRLLTFLNEPDIQRFSALMHEEAREHPQSALVFYGAAYERTLKYLQDAFEQATNLQSFKADPKELADMLLGMWEGMGMVRVGLCIDNEPFKDPHGWAARVVDIFLGGACQ